ncbi:hypothetical protein D3C77_703200 [compost metagenome]
MDLSDAEAQAALTNGVKVNSRVYGHCKGSWYQFHCHHDNMYHGFKIEIQENNVDHMRALSIATTLNFQETCGQIFTDPENFTV